MTTSTPAAGRADRRLLASAGWVTGANLVAQAFAYGSLIVLARLLPPSGFGTLAIGTTVVYGAALAVDHGVHGGLVVRPSLDRRTLVRAACRSLLISLALAAVMAALARPLVSTFAAGGDPDAFAALALCLPLHAVGLVPTALLQRTMRFGRLAGLTAVANVVSAAAAVAVGWAGFGVWALVVRLVGVFALLAVLALVCCPPAVREALAGARPDAGRHRGDRWFFLFGVAFLLTTNLDNLVLGASTDAALVGLYALAFTVAMTPSTQFAEQVGRVLFAAAAASPATSREQAERSFGWMSMLLLPLLPVGVVLAPVVLPAVLGAQWAPAVPAFRVLLVMGVAVAIVNCVGEALAGAGFMAFRATVMVGRCVAALAALLVLVPVGGITGAAVAQLAVFVPAALVYCTVGARLLGSSGRALWRRARPAVTAVAAQAAVTGVALLALPRSGMPAPAAAALAAVLGLLVAAGRLGRRAGWTGAA